MEGLLVLLAIAALAAPVLLIVFMVWTMQLSRRVRDLEGLVARIGHVPAPSPEPAPPAAQAAAIAPPATTTSAEVEPEAQAGPWVGAKPVAPQPTPPQNSSETAAMPPRAVVLRADKLAALGDWLKANWIYAVSAVSLAFAGLFLVQYGIETGLLTPAARVAVALLFGAALVAGGEYIRRRWGDRDEAVTAYLPSVFSGAGIVTLFGGVLAALHLYGLVGPGMGFAGLVAVAALAVGLGWYSGPLLAALGIAGAYGAPFLTGGESNHPELFYGYFALVAVTGLAIDAGRRWGWVSLLALAGAYPAVTLLWLGADWPELYALVLTGLVLAAMAIPTFTLAPAQGGAALVESVFKGRPRGWPEFPTRLVAGSMAASVAGLFVLGLSGAGEFWLALIALTALFFAIAVWADRAQALEDLAILPGLALTALPVVVAAAWVDPYRAFDLVRGAEEGTPVPATPYLILAFALAVSLMAAWRSRRGARWPVAWGAGAALVAPLVAGGIEFGWQPADLLGAYGWALAVIGVAAAMVALALAFARDDGESRPRVAGFALAALALIALALAVVFTKTALTLSFAVLAVAAAALDRRFTLRPLSVAVQVGAIGLTYRLLIDPGLGWAFDAPWWEMLLAFAGPLAATFAALWLYRPLTRPAATAVAESAGWTIAAVFASVVTIRLVDDFTPGTGTESHWFTGLLAVIWFAAAANQLWRVRLGGWLAKLRWALASVYGVIGLFVLAVGLTFLNPAVDYSTDTAVHGWPLLNTLILGYLLPALVLLAVGLRFTFLPRKFRLALTGGGLALAVVWLVLAIRHFWRGAEMDMAGFSQPELYTYTMVLLIAGAGLLYQAIARRSDLLRKAAMAVIGLTVAKVFLVDISGLVGLLRVFSFLALGLALAGLAFLNRWAASRMEEGEETGD
ncbi:DUF2339 domain-containing protein [Sinisalibacter aestuarii]|nr:DUF2339 domain-containing protein [Sinisalibacter aestuarii]